MSPTDPGASQQQAEIGSVGEYRDITDDVAYSAAAALDESQPAAVASYVKQDFPVVRAGALSSWTIGAHIDLYRDYVAQANMLARCAVRPVRANGAWVGGTAMRNEAARRLAAEVNAIRLHEWYFQQLAVYRKSPMAPNAPVREAMTAGYGSFDGWIDDVRQIAGTRSPGWVLAYWDARSQRLVNGWIDLHELSDAESQSVVFVLDLWEHAYWNDFGPEGRASYVDTILQCTDWAVVARRFEGVLS